MLTVKDGKKFDWASLSMEECASGNALDASYTLRVHDELISKLENNGSLHVFEKLLVPLFPVFASIEYKGLGVNPDELGVVGATLHSIITDIEDILYASSKVHKTAKITSTKDLVDILYSPEGFGLYPPNISDKGNPSTDKPTLDTLLTQIDDELESRAKKKTKSR